MRTRQRSSLLSLVFIILLEVLVTVNMATKGDKRYMEWKRRKKTVPIADNMIIYIEHHRLAGTALTHCSAFLKPYGKVVLGSYPQVLLDVHVPVILTGCTLEQL